MRVEGSINSEVATEVKDEDLIKFRRRQIVDVGVKLLILHGYHKTTTRMLAKEIGISMGSLYAYISKKEDILYLICDVIHAEAEQSLKDVLSFPAGSREALKKNIREYFLICNRMSDHIVAIYQITHLLTRKWQKRVLDWEVTFTNLFIETLKQLKEEEMLDLDDDTIDIIGHNISVVGQAWAFRRWYYGKHFTIEQYIEKQTNLVEDCVTRSERTHTS
jgi:AcrR family transcriptional regulator